MGRCFLVQVETFCASYPIGEQIHELIDGAEKAHKVGYSLIIGFNCHVNLTGIVSVFYYSEHGSNPLEGLGRVPFTCPKGVGRVRGADRLSADPLGYSNGKCT